MATAGRVIWVKWLCVALLVSTVHAQPTVRWQPTLQMAKQLAAQSNRLVLVHLWSPSCIACSRMEQEVFVRPEVASVLEANYVAVKLNADHFPTTARQYGVTSLPTDLIITPQGQMIEKIVGFRPAGEYIAALNWVAQNARGLGLGAYAQIPGASLQGNTGNAAVSYTHLTLPTIYSV